MGRKAASNDVKVEKPRGFDDFELRLGDVMRGERATMGKSLLDVQRELKIKATYIAAIENSDTSAFESPGFIAGYVRSYARYLNLDPEWAFEGFCREADFVTIAGGDASVAGLKKGTSAKAAIVAPTSNKLQDPTVSFAPPGEALLSKVEPGAIGSTFVLVALIAALGYGGWTVLQQVQRVDVTPVDQVPGVIAQVDPLAGSNGFNLDAPEFAGVESATPDALERLYRPQTLDTPVMTARDGPIAAIEPGSIGALAPEMGPEGARIAELSRTAPALDPFSGGQSAQPTVGTSGISVVAVRPAWVRVNYGDGSDKFEKTLSAGEIYQVPSDRDGPVLRAGAAGGVYIALDGTVYGPVGVSGSVVGNVDLSKDAVLERFTVADLSLDPALKELLQQTPAEDETQFAQQISPIGTANPGAELPRVTGDGPAPVTIVATTTSWVRIKGADGSFVHEATMQKGDTYTVPLGVGVPQIRSGNAGAIFFSVNGQTFGPLGGNGEVRSGVTVVADAITQDFSVADLNSNPGLQEVIVACGGDLRNCVASQ